jgi:hypothetical protein
MTTVRQSMPSAQSLLRHVEVQPVTGIFAVAEKHADARFQYRPVR